MDSILKTIKQMLGITSEQTDFDSEIIVHINTVINILHQLGIMHAHDHGYYILSDDETWDEYLNNMEDLQMVKTYMYLKVRLIFDPPLNATVISSMEKQIAELEWRLKENHTDYPKEAEDV